MARAGAIYADSDHLNVKGNWPCVSGSKVVPRDLDALLALQWWSPERPIEVPEIPRDAQGQPMRLCSHCGEWVRKSGFAKDSLRRDGLDSTCRECRHQNYLRGKATSGKIAASAK